MIKKIIEMVNDTQKLSDNEKTIITFAIKEMDSFNECIFIKNELIEDLELTKYSFNKAVRNLNKENFFKCKPNKLSYGFNSFYTTNSHYILVNNILLEQFLNE